MFDRFSPTCKTIADAARTYTKLDRRAEILPEDILLAMLATDASIAHKALTSMGKKKDDIEKFVKGLITELNVPQAKAGTEPTWSRACGEMMEKADGVSQALGIDTVNSEHMLAALPETSWANTQKFMDFLGVPRDKFLSIVIDIATEVGRQQDAQPLPDGYAIIGVLEPGQTQRDLQALMIAVSMLRGIKAVDYKQIRMVSREQVDKGMGAVPPKTSGIYLGQ